MKYYDEYGTPLKWHKFLKYIALPLSCAVSLFRIFGLMAQDSAYQTGYDTTDMLFLIISLIIQLVTLYGFHTWKPCGFYGILANYGIGVVYDLYALCIYGQYAPSMTAYGMGQLLGSLVVAIPVTIYYCKRRLLFFPEMRQQYMDMMYQSPAPQRPAAEVRLADKSGGDGTRCSCCGAPLNMGRDACMKCGTAVPHRQDAETAQPDSAAGAVYCRKCGSKLIEDSSFCSHCGTQVI